MLLKWFFRNNADKRRKVLRADRHYDTILDEHEQDELSNFSTLYEPKFII